MLYASCSTSNNDITLLYKNATETYSSYDFREGGLPLKYRIDDNVPVQVGANGDGHDNDMFIFKDKDIEPFRSALTVKGKVIMAALRGSLEQFDMTGGTEAITTVFAKCGH